MTISTNDSMKARGRLVIAFGCVLLILSLATLNGDSKALSAESALCATQGPSPTPAPIREPDGPNPLRRFLLWTIQPVARLFKKPPPACRLPPIVMITSSTSLITVCPVDQWSPTCSKSSEVTLWANATAPNGEMRLYTWSVTGGRLKGEGRNVTWDLSGLPEGTYTATVEANDGHQLTPTASASVTVAHCQNCTTVVMPCPTISVSCPREADRKQRVVFEATVSGGPAEIQPTYKWSITAGQILSGQGTSKLTVDVSEFSGKSVTAAVSIGGGYNPSCPTTQASCTITDLQ